MTDLIRLKDHKSPFNYRDFRLVEVVWSKGLTLQDVRRQHFEGRDVLITLDGELVQDSKLHKYYPMPGQVIGLVPSMGDDTGQILGIAVAVLAIATGQIWGAQLGLALGVSATTGAAILSLGVSIIGGLAVSALTRPPDAPTMDLSGYNITQAYSWNPQTTQQQGTVIPRPYGTHKVFGNIVAAYRQTRGDKQYVNALISLGQGPVTDIRDFKINGQPYENYQGVEIHTRLGNLDQDPIPNFNDTPVEYPLSVKISKLPFRAKNTNYALGKVITPKVANGHCYICTDPGKTGSSEPTWPTGSGATVADGGVVWTENGAYPYVYTTTGDAFDGLEVDITFPNGLYQYDAQGNIVTKNARVMIEYSVDGGANWTILTHRLVDTEQKAYSGKWSAGFWLDDDIVGLHWYEIEAGTTSRNAHKDGDQYTSEQYIAHSPFWRWITSETVTVVKTTADDYLFAKKSRTAFTRTFKTEGTLTHGEYQIRVSRTNDDSSDSRVSDDMYLTTIREISYDDYEYPMTALVGIKALATDQLSGSFNFSCIVDGAPVWVSENGITGDYEYSNNTAWVAYDMATQPLLQYWPDSGTYTAVRYDKMKPARVSGAKFAELAADCNTQVDDGDGGTENRSEFDAVFDSGATLWDCLLRTLKTARAVPFYQGLDLTLAINKAGSPVQTITMGSALKDSLKQSWSAISERPNELTVEFTNKDNDYQREPRTVINADMTSNRPALNLDMFGVVRQSQIYRDSMFYLNCNNLLTNTVSIQTGISSVDSTLGDIVNISHDVPQWGYSGRLSGVDDDNIVILDRDVTLEEGKTYVIKVKLSDDTIVDKVIAAAIDERTLQVTVPFATMPAKFDEYAFGETGQEVKPFRILSIQPDMDLKYSITAIEYNASIYGGDEGAPVLQTPNYSGLNEFVTVSDLVLTDSASVDEAGVTRRKIHAAWTAGTDVAYKAAKVYVRLIGEPWTFAGETDGYAVDVKDVLPGTVYEVMVVGINTTGTPTPTNLAPTETIQTSAEVQVSNAMLTKTVSGLQLFGQGNNTVSTGKHFKFTWNKISTVDNKTPAGQELYGAGSSNPDPNFRDYEVTIKNNDGTVRRKEYISAEQYEYTYEKNYGDG